MTNTIKVQWIGGPDDGKEFEIPDTFRSLNVPKPINPNFFATEEFDSTEVVPLNYTVCPIYLTFNGYRINYPY